MIVSFKTKLGSHTGKLSIINSGSDSVDMKLLQEDAVSKQYSISASYFKNGKGKAQIMERFNSTDRGDYSFDHLDLIPVPMSHPYQRLYFRTTTDVLDMILTNGIYPTDVYSTSAIKPLIKGKIVKPDLIMLTDGISDLSKKITDKKLYDAVVAVDVTGLRLFIDPRYISFFNITNCAYMLHSNHYYKTLTTDQIINSRWFVPLLCYTKHIKPERLTRVM